MPVLMTLNDSAAHPPAAPMVLMVRAVAGPRFYTVAMSRIAIIGTGYVGLTTGACFAHLGHDVICADIDERKIERLKRGEIPIVEAGLDKLVVDGLRSGKLSFVVGAVNAAATAEFAYLCVPTPQGDDGSADLTYIQGAAREIAAVLPSEAVVVNKSTVPVGSTKVVEKVMNRPDVKVVSNPEFLREGSAVHDFLNPDRIVIGADDQAAAIKVASLYLGVAAPLIVTDPASAETIKYAANAFLSTKISFINAVAAVCEAVGADVNAVVLGIGYDKRIGQDFLKPGPGWGGSCFPKDTYAMIRIAEDAGYDFKLLRGVVEVNNEQRRRVVTKIASATGGSVAGKVVAIWGLTFKARTDDLRESPSLDIAAALLADGAIVRGYDPTVSVPNLDGIEVMTDPYSVCEGADVLAVLTEWDEFRWLDVDKVASLMKHKAVVDARNLLDRAALIRAGFAYQGIGRN
jgi:UDPglucose 6-dehydrogenase